MLLGIDERGIVYVEGDLRRRSFEGMLADTAAAYQAFRPELLAVETNLHHELLPLELRREFTRAGLLTANIQAVENTLPKRSASAAGVRCSRSAASAFAARRPARRCSWNSSAIFRSARMTTDPTRRNSRSARHVRFGEAAIGFRVQDSVSVSCNPTEN